MSKPTGRPIEYIPEVVTAELLEYIKNSKDPYIEEYCLLKTSPSKDTVYRLAKENKCLSDAIKECHVKQQLRTVRGAENGEINSTFAIFKLKQKCYGWTDKQEIVSENHNYEEKLSESEILARYDELMEKAKRDK